MNLQDQLCTFEQAEQLAALGVVQGKSVFYYSKPRNEIVFQAAVLPHASFGQHSERYSLFGVAELAMLCGTLPDYVFRARHGVWVVRLANQEYRTIHPTEASARADLLIYLLKMELVYVEECNANL